MAFNRSKRPRLGLGLGARARARARVGARDYLMRYIPRPHLVLARYLWRLIGLKDQG